jgi:uncharacterized protein YgiM (DUF1202 family)
MIDQSQHIPQGGQDPFELLRRAKMQRRNFAKLIENSSSITDSIPTLNTLMQQPQLLINVLTQRAVMHALVIAIIPFAMLVSNSGAVQLIPADPVQPAIVTTSDDFTVDAAPITSDSMAQEGDAPLIESEDLPVPLSLVSRNQIMGPSVVPVTVIVDKAFMRNGPGTNYDPITRAAAGTELQVIGKYGDWYQVRERIDAPTYWMAGELLSLPDNIATTMFDIFDNEVPPLPPPRTGIVLEAGLTLRDGPGTNYVPITTLSLNAEVELLESYQDWYHIAIDNRTDGWVRADFLAITDDVKQRIIAADAIPDPNPELVGVITGDLVNLRRGPDSRHAKLGSVDKGTRFDLIGKHKDWVQVKYNNVKAWVFKDLISASSHVLRRVPTTKDFPALPVAPVRASANFANISTSSDVANIALQYVGYAYVWGGTTPRGGFDCSGLMLYAFKQVGVTIPRVASAQFNASNGVQVGGYDNLAAGDMMFFRNTSGRRGITHVSMYIGGGKMVHAMTPRYGVQISSIYDQYWLDHYAGAVRIKR